MLGSLFDYAKDVGKRLFTSDEEAGANILKYIDDNNPGVLLDSVTFADGTVTLVGKARHMVAKEKTVLLAGNVKGVEKVVADDLWTPPPKAEEPPPEPVQYYTIQSGDSLSKIAKQFYGNAMKYPAIFEANKEVIVDANKIYPGQKIRIPKLDQKGE